MADYGTQKQTHHLRKFRPHSGIAARNILRKPRPIRRTGILFASIAATAGISTFVFALQHDVKPTHQSIKTDVRSSSVPSTDSSLSADNTSVTIDTNASSSASPEADVSSESVTSGSPQVSGQAVINNEVIPLTEGTVQRTYTDANGTQSSVTITVGGSSTTDDSSRSRTSLHVDTSSSLNSDINTTRGSPIP